MSTFCVITTINKPTEAFKQWESIFGERLIVIGDRKTPEDWRCERARFFNPKRTDTSSLSLHKMLPYDHYSRKNIGYLMAFLEKPGCLFDTDDDNAPNKHWTQREQSCSAEVIASKGWCNIYAWMQDEYSERAIWPRGLPLTKIRDPRDEELQAGTIDSPIQQGLADKFPDVDAIHRLIDPGMFLFQRRRSIALSEGVWSPFNSQSTWWFPEAFPLMYLPVTASFRMTDIWRSFVAQRCLWAMGKRVVFHSPSEVDQDRNVHDLMADFRDEVSGYLYNEKIAECLMELKLKPGTDIDTVLENLRTCYKDLTSRRFLDDAMETECVDRWINDVRLIYGSK